MCNCPWRFGNILACELLHLVNWDICALFLTHNETVVERRMKTMSFLNWLFPSLRIQMGCFLSMWKQCVWTNYNESSSSTLDVRYGADCHFAFNIFFLTDMADWLWRPMNVSFMLQTFSRSVTRRETLCICTSNQFVLLKWIEMSLFLPATPDTTMKNGTGLYEKKCTRDYLKKQYYKI